MIVNVASIRPPTDIDRTKRSRRHQWCVDGAHALGWVLPTPQAERVAKAAGYHGAWNRLSESCIKHKKIVRIVP